MSASPLRVQQMLFCRLTGPQKIKNEEKKKGERKSMSRNVWSCWGFVFFFALVELQEEKKRFTKVISSPLIDGWLSLQGLLKKEMAGKLHFGEQSV